MFKVVEIAIFNLKMEIRREIEALVSSPSNLSVFKVDKLTPHKVSVLLLVQQYLKVKMKQ